MEDKADPTVNSAHLNSKEGTVRREVSRDVNGLVKRGEHEESDDDIPNDGVDLGEVFWHLGSKWKVLLYMTIAGGLVAGLIAFVLPNMYTATALIIPPAKPQSLSSIVMGQLGGLTAAFAPSLGLKDPNEMYIGILRSRTTNDDLVRRFDLQQVYSSETTEAARRKLLDRASVALGRDAMIKISVEDRDPTRAAALANAFITELNLQNNRLALTESGQRRLFFEHEVENEKRDLVTAESRLRETQQKTGFVEVNNQAQMVISSIARLRAEITMQEVSLQRLRMGATAENPEVEQRQSGLSALRAELTKLETGNVRQKSGDPIVPVANVPQAGLEYLRALREVKFHESLFEVLSKQYEAARIDEAKDAPVIQVVDAAVPPQRKSGPPRGLITLFGAFLSMLCGIIYVYSTRDRHSSQNLVAPPDVQLAAP